MIKLAFSSALESISIATVTALSPLPLREVPIIQVLCVSVSI